MLATEIVNDFQIFNSKCSVFNMAFKSDTKSPSSLQGEEIHL